MNLRLILVATIGLNVCIALGALAADDHPSPALEVPARLQTLSEEQVSERLRFAEERLDYRRRYAQGWQYGWTSFYGLGVAVQSYQAARTDSAGRRADYIASSIKAVGGIAEKLINPLRARKGAEALREMPDATREDRLRRLARAEDLLRTDAKQAQRRYSVLRHGGNIAVNSLAAVIVSNAFETDEDRAWKSAAVGMLVGEAMIWSQPWWPRRHLKEYEARFGLSGPQVSWQIVPTLGGAAIVATF